MHQKRSIIERCIYLYIFLKKINLVPGEPGFSWDLSLLPHYYKVPIVNPMGRILVCWNFCEKHLKILCHPICNLAV